MWYVKDFILTSQRLLAIHYLYSDIWIDCIVFMLLRLCDGVPVILPCHREIIFEILDLYMHENRTIVFWCLDAVVCYPEFSLSDKIQYLLSAVILLVHDDNSEQAIKIFKWSCSFCFINKSSCFPCFANRHFSGLSGRARKHGGFEKLRLPTKCIIANHVGLSPQASSGRKENLQLVMCDSTRRCYVYNGYI